MACHSCTIICDCGKCIAQESILQCFLNGLKIIAHQLKSKNVFRHSWLNYLQADKLPKIVWNAFLSRELKILHPIGGKMALRLYVIAWDYPQTPVANPQKLVVTGPQLGLNYTIYTNSLLIIKKPGVAGARTCVNELTNRMMFYI